MLAEGVHEIVGFDEGERAVLIAENIQPAIIGKILQRQEHHRHFQNHTGAGMLLC